MRRPGTKDLLATAAGLFLGLAATELALRALDLPEFHAPRTFPEQLEFRVLPDGTLWHTSLRSRSIEFVYDGNPRGYFDGRNAIRHSTNAYGFRGGDFSMRKDPGTFRVVFLGDSFTFGEGVKDGDVYPEKLRAKLARSSPGRVFESLNFGVPGFNAEQSVYLLKNLALRCDPDAVVLGYTLNDAEPPLFGLDATTGRVVRRARERSAEEAAPSLPPPERGVYATRVAQLLWKAFDRARRPPARTIAYYRDLYRPDNPGWIAAQRSIQEFAGICARNDTDCYFLVFPVLFELGDSYPFTEIHGLLRRAVEAAGTDRVHFVDLLPALRGKKDASLWVHPTDQHPNEEVHEAAASLLLERMQR